MRPWVVAAREPVICQTNGTGVADNPLPGKPLAVILDWLGVDNGQGCMTLVVVRAGMASAAVRTSRTLLTIRAGIMLVVIRAVIA